MLDDVDYKLRELNDENHSDSDAEEVYVEVDEAFQGFSISFFRNGNQQQSTAV